LTPLERDAEGDLTETSNSKLFLSIFDEMVDLYCQHQDVTQQAECTENQHLIASAPGLVVLLTPARAACACC